MATINEIIQSAVDRVKLKGSETWIKWSFWTRAKDVELNSGKNVETAVSELDENISNEIDRATDRENEIETALNSEITRAKSAESTLSTSINNEITRAKNAENTLETNKVPITRTINGKALSSDITLSASDVGADASGSANTALTNAKAYTDTKVADLVGSAPETLDTLGEIADALKDNADIVDVLNESITTKANASDLTSHASNNTVHITADERATWNAQGENIELLEEEVDGIDIGGRNYCRNNSYWKSNNTAVMTITNNDDGSATITKNGSGQAIHCYIPFSKTLEVGETYTLTVKYKMTSTLDTCGLWTYNYNTLNSINNGEVNGVELYATDDYVVESTTLSIITKENCNSLFVTSSALVVGDTIDIAWIKVEKGNKSTDWTPNPDDVGTESTLGLTKLYAETGTNADGSMTQSAITTELNGKAASSHTHNYAGSSSAGGAATTALACTGNSATATKLATPVTINDTTFDGLYGIRLKNLYGWHYYGGQGNGNIFAKGGKNNTNGRSCVTLLIASAGNYGNVLDGVWLVKVSNRNNATQMDVRCLQPSESSVEFGWYSDDEYFYFGAWCPQYTTGMFCMVLGHGDVDKMSYGKIAKLTTKPDTWTVVETLYTPQPSATDTVAGIGKLYTATGTGTDGTMTQSAITTELGKYLPLAGGTVSGNIIPSTTNNSLILGSSTNRWGTVYTNNHDANYIYLRKYMVLQEAPATPKIINYATYSQTVYSSSSADAETSTSTVELGGGQTYFYGTYHNLDTVLKGYRLRLNADSKMSTNVALAIASDEKVKSFTTDIDTDEEKLVKLFDIIKPKSYNYKYLKSDNLNGLNIGFSAQEIEQAMIDLDIDPEKYGILNIQYGHMLSRGNDFEDGKYYTKFYEISYNDLFNLSLLKTHMMEKEHVERLVALEEKASKLDELEARLSALENK